MTDFNELVDTARIQKAHDDFAALQQAERDATANVAASKVAAKNAHAAAQAAADRGDAAEKLLLLEVKVDDTDRAARVAERVLEAARKRLQAGDQTHRHEIKQAHAGVVRAAIKARVAAVRQAAASIEQLKASEAEFMAADSVLVTAFNNAGVQSSIDTGRRLLDENGVFPRGFTVQHHEAILAGNGVDVESGTMRWME